MKDKMVPIMLTLLTSVFVLVGLFFLYGALSNLLKSHRAASWPTATAALTTVEVKRHATSKRPTYEAVVRYTYQVSGQSYVGSNLSVGYGGSSNLSHHQALVQKLESAKTVVVHYDPDKPAESVLIAGTHRADWSFLAFSLTWLLALTGMITTAFLGLQTDASWLDRLVVVEEKTAP